MTPQVELLLPTAWDGPTTRVALAPRLVDLERARVGLISNRWRSVEIMYDVFRTQLPERHGISATQSKYSTTTGPVLERDYQELVESVDAVIVGLGN